MGNKAQHIDGGLLRQEGDRITAEYETGYCGLACGFCQPDGSCRCKAENHCGKRLSPQGCHQYDCCVEKGLNGCWECEQAPCGIDMLAPDKIKLRAFIRCIREDGLAQFAQYLQTNERNGVVYHRNGITGDYDLESEERILQLLRAGNPEKEGLQR